MTRAELAAAPLRFWICRHTGRETQWKVLTQTNDEPTARLIYRWETERRPGGVRLIDVDASIVLKETGARGR